MELRFDFASDDKTTGFRIKYFELYNWGTFDKKVVRIKLDAHNALLTGDIGSGKSTIVDGLTTLLVPHQKITFNKAAGAQFKERDLKSYIIGEYKSQKNDNYGSSKAVSLRSEKGFTVLLARFENEGFDESFSIAQFFYISNKKVNKLFITSKIDLSIKKDFIDVNFENIRGLKKYLKEKNNTEVYSSFKDYSKDFSRAMGIRNDQALNLFYQTVSLKSIDNLTSFVREQMLEAGDIDSKIDELCQNFSELNLAYRLVVKAKEQIELLTPIDKNAKLYESLVDEQSEKEFMRESLTCYFAKFKKTLLIEKLQELQIELQKKSSLKIKVANEEKDLINKKVELRVEIQKNGGNRLKQLTKEIEENTTQRDTKKQINQKYNSLAKELELPIVSNEHRFLNNKKDAKEKFETINESNAKLQNEIVRNEVSLEKNSSNLEEMEAEIVYLQHNRSNIPKHISSIRDKIAKQLKIEEKDLPFAGELIEVNDKQWQGAIERIMHNFSLSLLVLSEHYEDVSEYVNSTDLKGKLVYLKVINKKNKKEYFDRAKNSLLNKINIKADSHFFEPLKSMLEERFDIPCVEDMYDFRKFKKALTINGQFKTNYAKHEKDDRFRLDDKSRWSLGWDNALKLEAMQKNSKQLKEKIDFIKQRIKELHVELEKLKDSRDNLRDILQFEVFSEIDWYIHARKIEDLSAEFKELEKSSNIIQSLQMQLNNVEEKLKEVTPKKEELDKNIGKLESNIENKSSELELAKTSLKTPIDKNIELKLDAIFSKSGLSLVNISSKEKDLGATIQNKIAKILKESKTINEKILTLMNEYKHKFVVESKEFDASVNSIGDFRAKLNELKRDDLPKFEKKFKSLFKEKTIQKTVMIQEELDHQSKQIKEKIKKINNSLREIEYNSGTFIELVAEISLDKETRDFKQDLKSATSFAFDENTQYNDAKFLQIKEIIDRFNTREKFAEVDKRWRAKVTDVRGWYNFSASERYVSNDEEKEYYAHSGGKSGGQKEKLAYTVLASSLAFQFGLEHNEIKSRSFRFVMIDEAFGRGSDESTRYALRLFEKLNLQLLAITPKQKINVIEDFVKSIHFVHNQDGMNSSILSMSIEEYQKKKK